MIHVSRLTAKGLADFAAFLARARAGGDSTPPRHLLTDPEVSVPLVPATEMPDVRLRTKRDAAEVLIKLLKPWAGPELLQDTGLWAWMSLYWFDDLCPVRRGKRKVNSSAHYIPEFDNHQRRYRQLLVAPYLIRMAAADHNALWLNAEIEVHGDLMENTLGRLYLVRIPAVREAMEALYLDPDKGKIRRGLFPKSTAPKRGDIRNRLPVRIKQLRMTFDLGAMNGNELIRLLGPEFESWRQPGN